MDGEDVIMRRQYDAAVTFRTDRCLACVRLCHSTQNYSAGTNRNRVISDGAQSRFGGPQ
jgi:hypothetical protein